MFGYRSRWLQAKLNLSQGCFTRLPAAAGAVERKGRSRPGVVSRRHHPVRQPAAARATGEEAPGAAQGGVDGRGVSDRPPSLAHR